MHDGLRSPSPLPPIAAVPLSYPRRPAGRRAGRLTWPVLRCLGHLAGAGWIVTRAAERRRLSWRPITAPCRHRES